MFSEVVTATKCGQHFIFRYEQAQTDALLDELATLADDRDCPLNWTDVAVLAGEVALRAGLRGRQVFDA